MPGDFDCQEGILSASLRAALCGGPTIATRRVRFPVYDRRGLVMALIAPNFLIRATERCVFGPVIDTPPIKSAEMNRASVPWAGSKTNFLDAREAGSVERTSWSARSCLPVVQRLLSTCHGTKLLGSSGSWVRSLPPWGMVDRSPLPCDANYVNAQKNGSARCGSESGRGRPRCGASSASTHTRY